MSAKVPVKLVSSRSCTQRVSAADAGLRGSIQRATIGRGEKEADQPVWSGCVQDMTEWTRRMERGRAKQMDMKMLNAKCTRDEGEVVGSEGTPRALELFLA